MIVAGPSLRRQCELWLLAALCLAVAGCCFGARAKSPEQLRTEMATQEQFSQEFESNRAQLVRSVEQQTLDGIQGYTPVSSEQAPASQAASQAAFVDPATGKVAWRALVCVNPKCPGNGKGGLVLLAKPLSCVRAGSNGQLIMGTPDISELKPFPCPVCGSMDYIRAYEPPETEQRREQLMRELQASYAAYGEAAKKKQRPDGVRSPDKIMEDLANLKKVFLVPQ